MEYCRVGEFFDVIAETGKFSEPVARFYFHQMIKGLYYMHNVVGVCHRDIKPENILMDADFNIKFSDFGFSCPHNGNNGNGKLNSYKGTPDYMTPEQHS